MLSTCSLVEVGATFRRIGVNGPISKTISQVDGMTARHQHHIVGEGWRDETVSLTASDIVSCKL